MGEMYFIWLILMAILLLIEIISLGLTTIWFAAGAFVAFIIAMIGFGFWIQIGAFVIISIILLIFTRPWAIKYLNSRTTKTNAEALVGKTARVIEDINNLKEQGQVVVNGLEWTARSSLDTVTFKKDDYVTIVGIEGVKLIVKKREEGE